MSNFDHNGLPRQARGTLALVWTTHVKISDLMDISVVVVRGVVQQRKLEARDTTIADRQPTIKETYHATTLDAEVKEESSVVETVEEESRCQDGSLLDIVDLIVDLKKRSPYFAQEVMQTVVQEVMKALA
ncbi:hypothetical protein DL546_000088 [Coniochaeta pulveracea]|uniref:Uncharacterized protein n=1 Tax=Coniochaeta pulveracea TaxID=177199 RepID=A0A420XVR8_9PEZI|nr:hypothetical protein DL546_000088 [Coniochaeta pulveracea]